MVLRGCFSLATLLLLAALPLPVEADPREQFNKGVELAEQGDFSGAVSVFVGVMDELEPAERGRAHKALGFCYRKLGKMPEAWHHLNSYLTGSSKNDETAARWLSEVRLELSATHKLVEFKSDDDGAWFAPGDGKRYPCPGQWWFKPGKYEIEAGVGAKSLFLPMEVPADAGDTGPVVVVALPQEIPAANGGEEALMPQQSSGLLWPWLTLGSGAGMLVTAGILHFIGHDRNEDLRSKYSDEKTYPDGAVAQGLYDDGYSKEVQPLMTSTYILYGVGGAAVIAGLAWLLLDSPGEPAASAFQAMPLWGPGEAGVQIQMGF